jgi:type IV secretory pathway VirB4 component/type IV secretory pathway TrbF-like protein
MMSLAEYRRKAQILSDFLLWAALVAKGAVLNKDGSFQRTARFRGPDLDSATPSELVAISGHLNNALRRLGSGWGIFVEAQRQPDNRYPESFFPDAVSRLVDAERRAQFEEEGAHFENRYFLTLVWLPPAEDAARAESWLYENRSRDGADWRGALAGFIDRTDRVLALIEGFMPEADWLDDAETLTYLHSCVSTRRQRVRVPETPMHLDAFLIDEDLTGGLEPRLGRVHLRTLTVMGFPSRTWPGLLDDLNRLAFPYRWTTRAICLDKTDAVKVLGRIRRQWFAKRKSIMAILKEVMTNEASVLVDSDAANKALDADAALQELGSDLIGEAYVPATVTVWDEDGAKADDRLRLVEKAIQGRDFTCMRETVNAIEAWLGGLPGHVYANVRQPLISTLNLAHMMPFSAVWAGPERDEHLGAPPLFFARTEGSTPFRFSLHVGDVGHTLIVGPTGAGKSVLLALMALQFRRYAHSQVFAFDFGGSIWAAALAMGGDWLDLGGALSEDVAEPVALQPLARIEEPRSTVRYGRTPEPETPYQRAGQVWDERIGSARVQAKNWRLAFFGMLTLSGGLAGGLVWQSARGTVTPWVVEVDKLGQAQAVAPAVRDYRPTDPQIAWHLARFIEEVRSIPADAVVLRQNWLEAYNYVADKGALALSDYARTSDPFSKVDKAQVSVEVVSVIRASPDSFRVAWTERRYVDNALAATERWSAILTVVLEPPTDADRLKKNPLGVYVHALNWSKELG